MERSRLFETLREFKYAEGDMDFLKEEFERIAKAAFHSGYFLVNSGRPDEFKIEIVCIEFYYHELEGLIKDPKKLIRDFSQDVFPVGSMLPHEFGVDVNFDDNVSQKFRASFLIRGYRRIENGQVVYENNKKSKTWNSRDPWYDLFGSASFLEGGRMQIEWIDNGLPYDEVVLPEPQTRIFTKPVEGFNPKWRYVKQICLTLWNLNYEDGVTGKVTPEGNLFIQEFVKSGWQIYKLISDLTIWNEGGVDQINFSTSLKNIDFVSVIYCVIENCVRVQLLSIS